MNSINKITMDQNKYDELNDLYIVSTSETSNEVRGVLAKEFVRKFSEVSHICFAISKLDLMEKFKKSLNKDSSNSCKQGAISICFELYSLFDFQMEIYSNILVPLLIDILDDKSKHVCDSAFESLKLIFSKLNPYYILSMIPYIFDGMADISWKKKVRCLELLEILSIQNKNFVGELLPQIVPHITENMWDTKKEVKNAAKKSLLSCCSAIHNPDIKSIVPDIVSANANPDENVSALDKLMGTTFVSQVDKQTLSIIVPVLARGLRSRDVQSKRKCCVVVDNMCKLVCDPKDVEPFIDKLLPELIKVEKDVPIPEIREYGKKARNTLSKAIEEI